MTIPSGATSMTGLVNNKFTQAQQAFNTPAVAAPAAPAVGAAQPAAIGLPGTAAPAAPNVNGIRQMMTDMMQTLILELEKKRKAAPSLAQRINNQEFGRVRPLEKPVKVKSVGISPLSDAGE